MTRSHWIILVTLAFVLPGCAKKTEETAAYDTPTYEPVTTYNTTTPTTTDPYATNPYSGTTYERDPYASDPFVTSPVRTRSTTSPDEEVIVTSDTTTSGRTHTVGKGDTLFGLARQYYGDQSRWREIWEANRAQLPNPDKLRVGMALTIP